MLVFACNAFAFSKYSFIDWLSLTVPIFAYELAIAADAIKNALQRILLS